MSTTAGLTLVEVLVALVILSVAVVATLQLFGGGLRLARAAGDHVGATLLASAMLTEEAATPLEEGTTQGTEGAYRWVRRVTLEPALLPFAPSEPAAARVHLARISVEVAWGKNRRVEMETLRAWSSKS